MVNKDPLKQFIKTQGRLKAFLYLRVAIFIRIVGTTTIVFLELFTQKKIIIIPAYMQITPW